MNDSCDAIQDRLVKLHLTGIPITDDPEVKAHLENCSPCRIYNDFLDHDHRALEVYAKSLDTYVDQVKQRLHRQIEHTKPGHSSRIIFSWWAAAGAILLIVGWVFFWHGGPTDPLDRPGSDQGRVTAQSNAESPTAQIPTTDDRDVLSEPEAVPTAKTLPVKHTDPDANGGSDVAMAPDSANQPLAKAEMPIEAELGSGNEAKEGTVDHMGTVVTVQGDPVPDIQVFLCQHAMDVSVNNGIPSSDANAVRTDGKGRFMLDSKRPVTCLVAVGEEGIVQVEYDEFQENRVMTLEPWVTVKGDLMTDGQPAIGYMLETLTRDALESRGGVDAYSHCNTDAQGRFEFNRIPPGPMILYGREYDVRAGQTYELHLGAGGQSVVGQFVLPGYTDRGGLLRGEPILCHVISLDMDQEPVDMSPLQETVISRVFQQTSSNEMGQFQVDHLEPGRYALVGGSWNHDSMDRQKPGYRVWHEFIVPSPSEEAQGDIPIELGNVELILGDLRVGDEAPNFDLWDLEGNVQNLGNTAEKLLLLSFYRLDDLAEPSPALQDLKDIQTQFGSMDSFVLMGMLTSDSPPLRDRELIRAAGFNWPQIPLGRNGLNRTHIEYDVLNTPWPWNILISPDGTILAMGLQGEALIEAVATHLP